MRDGEDRLSTASVKVDAREERHAERHQRERRESQERLAATTIADKAK